MEKQEAEIRQINIKGKVVNFREQELTYKNAVIINKVTAIENLRLFATVAAKNKLKYVLAYGTLLGIIREKDLISYDIDVDASIFQEIEFLTLLPKFEQVGFDLVRFEEGILYTLKKETVYIDFYVLSQIPRSSRSFKQLLGSLLFYKECGLLIPKFCVHFTRIKAFSDFKISIPLFSKFYVIFIYGKEWSIPKTNVPGYGARTLSNGFRRVIKSLIYLIQQFKFRNN